MVPRKPAKKALSPKSKAGPPRGKAAPKQKGLLGKLPSPLGDPMGGLPSFTPPPRPMNMPNMGIGHDSNKKNPKGTGQAGVGPKGKPR